MSLNLQGCILNTLTEMPQLRYPLGSSNETGRKQRAEWAITFHTRNVNSLICYYEFELIHFKISWAQIHKGSWAPKFHINLTEAIQSKTKNPKTAARYIGDHPCGTMPHHLELFEAAPIEVAQHKWVQRRRDACRGPSCRGLHTHQL